jgi:eukaryotic-like serine/threonine-protein kinase
VYHAQGKLERSAAMRRFTGEVRARTLGPDHPQTLVAWTNLAFILVDKGELDEAKTILEDLLERRSRTLGAGHNEVGLTLGLLGMVELRRSDWPAAEGFYRRSLDIREKLLPEGNGVRGLTMNALGHAMAMQGRRTEAEPLLTIGAEWVLADSRAPGRNKKDAAERVARLYEEWGKPEQAAAWREKLPK